MRYLGIDFGHKKIGLALSDEQGDFVYPYSVIPNEKALKTIVAICQNEKVGEIVIGDTKDLKGGRNSVSDKVEEFFGLLKEQIGLPVSWQTEVFSTREAERTIGEDEMRDARAAAIILQSFLDKRKNSLQ